VGSITPGHPERGVAPGVETTTGPLGQGISAAVGMAMAEAHLVTRFNRLGHTLVDHHTYTIVGDGDLQEGVASEAASLAGHLHLNKLIALYDSNRISLAASTKLTFTEDVGKRFEAYAQVYPDLAAEWKRLMSSELPEGWDKDIPTFSPADKPIATRSAGGKTINAIAAHVPELVGGSADLNPSTDTALKGRGDFQSPLNQAQDRQGAVGGEWGYAGRNLHFGVREHAMAAVVSGLALHGGVIPFGATFLTFSDYMRPSIRLAAMMKLRVIYVFTHDSIGVGEDGPTHEPIEHVAALRAIPHLTVIRPADANETAQAWRVAMTHRDGPVALILTRQALPILAPGGDVARGAYILADADGTPDVILIAAGSEVSVALEAREKLAARIVRARVVSMPSWELFEAQPQEYRDQVLPPGVTARLAVEAGVPMGWSRYAGTYGDVVAIENRYGASAPFKTLMKEYGFTGDNVAARVRAMLA